MAAIKLELASGDQSLSVRRFAVHEQMSSLFSISIWARSPDEDIDLEGVVGQEASLALQSGLAFAALGGERRWTGVCASMELVKAEPTGLSTYYLRIVPRLWLLTQKRDHRLFQHISIPDIVTKVLRDWGIEHTWRIDRSLYPKLDLRSQYGESDYAFVSRLLEEAGISYFFEHDEKRSTMVLADHPQHAEPRSAGPLRYVDNPNQSAEQEFLTDLRLSQDVRPGRVTLRDHDFRAATKFQLFGGTKRLESVEDLLEQYVYRPGSFLVELPGGVDVDVPVPGLPAGVQRAVDAAHKVEDAAQAMASGQLAGKAKAAAEEKASGYVSKKVGDVVSKQVEKVAGSEIGSIAGQVAGGYGGKLAGKVAGGLVGALGRLMGDDKGAARFDPQAGQRRATVDSEALRASRRRVQFGTNALDLAPGTVFQVANARRSDLGPDKTLLVTTMTVEGSPDGEWTLAGEAVFGDVPYRPAQVTPKPSVQGLQSAVVVGSPGEEIHTDEYGRVRVQFHWDRQSGYDDNSSCWVRVSQGWAGPGFGMICLPRVHQEVLVAFLEGDPDLPVVVGRLFNEASKVPYPLPENKTKSGWKSDSTPGSGGYNELSFEDAKGRELVYVQAEKDLEALVKNNEARSVGVNRRTTIGAVDASVVGAQHLVTMTQAEVGKIEPTTFEMVDRRIRFSTGEASITLDGPNITLEAKGRVFIHSTDDDVELLGGPWVKINCGPPKPGESDTYTMHHITGVVRDQDGEPLAGQKVVVKASDGSIQQVETDASGRYFALVPPGKCQVRLTEDDYGPKGPNLDDMNEEAEELDDCGPAV